MIESMVLMALPVHAMIGKGPKCVLCHSAGLGQSFGAIEAAIRLIRNLISNLH